MRWCDIFVGATIGRPRAFDERPYKLDLRCLCYIGKHILNKDTISRGGIADEDVGHRAHELAVLDNG